MLVAGDAARDAWGRSLMVFAHSGDVRQRLPIGRSSAGAPRTYRIVRPATFGAVLARTVRHSGGVVKFVMAFIGERLESESPPANRRK